MKERIFFFNENSKQDKINTILNVSDSTVQSHIETITKIKSGNKIGYFQFKDDETYYKFYIMPKIYEIEEQECSSDCSEYQKQFIHFFKHYYRLIAKYNIVNYSDELEGNISDLSYKSENSSKELASDDIINIDDFIVHNYDDSLAVINSFFTKHKKQILIEQDFQSQSIYHKLNTQKNIFEPNKSNIHQIKKVPMLYSSIAVITIEVLKHFIGNKIKNFSNTIKSESLKRKANKINILLKQKFPNKYDFDFKIKELLLQKTAKNFNKNNEYKKLYKALLKLIGKEHYYDGEVYKEIEKSDEIISLFFQPAKLYEWILYDALISMNKYDGVLKDEKDNIDIKYSLVPSFNNQKYSSKPDLIILENHKKYPVDAKWKILHKKDSSFDNDISKLRRDAKVRGVNKGYLIYPKIDENSQFQLDTEYYYDFDRDFKFELKVISV